MDWITLWLLSFALAMDCFVVSITQSGGLTQTDYKHWVLMALSFGFFQGAMPLIGYSLMQLCADLIAAYDHWIALALLSFIGIKMIVEDLQTHEQNESSKAGYGWWTIVVLSFATSIDALATGIVFIGNEAWLWKGVACIALVSFLCSLAGSLLGYSIAKRLRFKFNLLGGIILIGIGIKIVVEHCCFS